MAPAKTANHNVTALTINVAAVESFSESPIFIDIKVKDPSVMPNPPGNIDTAPTIVEKL